LVDNSVPFENYSQLARQSWITSYILENGSVQVEDLSERFQVSRMTIHRDLDDLEHQGVLRKIRNGATAQPSSLFESDIRYRLKRQLREKDAVSRAVLDCLEPGHSIFLDEATTLLPLVRLLPSLAPLTVITNFLPILNELSTQKGIHLIALGGEYLSQFDTFTGLLTEQSMSALHADVYITSTTAVHDAVAYHPNQQVVRVKKAMIAHSSRQIMLLDYSKFGKTALHEVAPLTNFENVFVDEGINPSDLNLLNAKGVNLTVIPCGNCGE
jgi:DeoR/GlpR family transcriptional regulator of sugar metabolism